MKHAHNHSAAHRTAPAHFQGASQAAIQISQSGLSLAATSGRDHFVVSSLVVADAVITDFSLGRDQLAIRDRSVEPEEVVARLSLSATSNGTSTSIVVDAGTAAEHVLVTLQDVQASQLGDVIPLPRPEPALTVITSSGLALAGTDGFDRFVFTSGDLTGASIAGFTVGEDRLVFRGELRDVSDITLALTDDGSSTEVIVGAGTDEETVLATLVDVQAASLTELAGRQKMQLKSITVSEQDQSVAATGASDRFVFTSLEQEGGIITGFELGEDHLVIYDHKAAPGDLQDRLSLAVTDDGASTMLVVDAATEDEHVMVTLEGILVSDMAAILQSHGHHGMWGW